MSPEDKGNSPPSRRLKRIRQRLLAAILGAAGGLLTVLGAMALFSTDRIPEMTPERLSAAQQKWNQEQLTSYQIQVTVEGRQPGIYETEVRNHQVTKSSFNDQPLKSRRTMSTWSVDGMFRTLDYDVEAQTNQTETDPRLTLRAEFHSEYGFPQRYHRIQWGSMNELTWEVTGFTPLEGDK